MAKKKRGAADKIGHPEKRAFLAAYALCGSISLAAKSSGVVRQSHYDWMNAEDEEGELYRKEFEAAREEACEALEDEARRRGVEGINEPVIYKGKLMGWWVDKDGQAAVEGAPGAKFVPLTVKKYSDTLLIVLMNGNLPHKFKQPRRDNDDKTDEPPPNMEQVQKTILEKTGMVAGVESKPE